MAQPPLPAEALTGGFVAVAALAGGLVAAAGILVLFVDVLAGDSEQATTTIINKRLPMTRWERREFILLIS